MKLQTKHKLKKLMKSTTFWVCIVFLLLLILAIILYFSDSERIHREKSTKIQLSSEQMLIDYNSYWDMLEQNTFLLSQSPKAHQLKADYQTKIENNTDYLTFFQLLNDMTITLSQIEGFSQLELYKYRMFTQDRYSYQPIYEPSDPWKAVYTDPSVIQVYDDFNLLTHGVIHEKKEETPPIEMTATMANNIVNENVKIEILEENISVKITLHNMKLYEKSPLLLKAYQAHFSEIYMQFSQYETMIFDISKVSEGDDEFWMEFLVAPNIISPLSATQYRYCKNGENNQIYFKTTKLNQQLQPTSATQANMATDYIWKKEYSISPHSEAPQFQGNISILAADNTQNAGENFAYFCDTSGFAAISGTATSGISEQFPLYLYVLPNSRFVVQYNPFYWENGDGSCHDITGTVPK